MKHTYWIVGGTSGIGRAVVKRLQEDGHRVFTSSRTAQPPDGLPSPSHIPWDAATGDPPVDQLPDVLDGLVYAPGTVRLKPFHRLKDEDFREDFEINVLGAVRAVRACADRLGRAENGGSVVLFSTVAVQTGMPYHASIAAAKGAVEGLTRSLAAEFAPRIRVNAVAPSLTDTPLVQRLLASERHRDAAAARHPLARVGAPEDVAAAALHLLDPAASWVTGQILAVDGGMSALRLFPGT